MHPESPSASGFYFKLLEGDLLVWNTLAPLFLHIYLLFSKNLPSGRDILNITL